MRLHTLMLAATAAPVLAVCEVSAWSDWSDCEPKSVFTGCDFAAGPPGWRAPPEGAKKTSRTSRTAAPATAPDNAAYVALEPSDCSTDVGALATWIVEQLGEGAKFLQRPTHISRMIPVEGISGELDLVALAANVLPKHFDAIRRRGLRSATYEVIYEELHPSVHLFPSIVNAAIGDCLPEGYEIDLKKPSHSIICVVAGATAFMSVVEHYREKSKHFALHKALSAAA